MSGAGAKQEQIETEGRVHEAKQPSKRRIFAYLAVNALFDPMPTPSSA